VSRHIVHVDMDAFYAAVEQRDDASLRGKPVIVGGRSPRSVVCTASYEARPFGVKSAMPMGEATRRCPQAIVIPPRMAHYAGVSQIILKIKLRDHTLLSRRVTLDVPVADTMSVYRAAQRLLDRFGLAGAAVRLTGVAASGLVPVERGQTSLFRDESAERRNKLERTLEDVRARFGAESLVQAGLKAKGAGPRRNG